MSKLPLFTQNSVTSDNENVHAYLNAALSVNTWRAYRNDLQHFQAWGDSVPATSEQIACYLAFYAQKHTVATLTRRLVSLSKLHNTQQWVNSVSSALVLSTLQGIVLNQHGMKQRQVAPAIKEDILAMVRNLQGTKGIRDKELLLIGFADNAANQLTGNDIFKFIAKDPSDKITDYDVASDTVHLENAMFTALTTTSTLNTSQFKVGAQAADSNDFIIYNKTAGTLLYDADGSGAAAAIQIATIGTGLSLTNSDIIVV